MPTRSKAKAYAHLERFAPLLNGSEDERTKDFIEHLVTCTDAQLRQMGDEAIIFLLRAFFAPQTKTIERSITQYGEMHRAMGHLLKTWVGWKPEDAVTPAPEDHRITSAE